MGNTLQHPCHPHPLRRLDLAPGSNYSFRCCLCHRKLKAMEAAYCCRACRLFFHARCADSPPLIESHPFHPQHTLVLSHGIRQPFICSACGLRCLSGSAYACEGCGVHLGLACAISTAPDEGGRKVRQKGGANCEIENAGHEHPLTRFYAKSRIRSKCSACNANIRGEAYCCIACKYFLHKRCVGSPGTSAVKKEESPPDNTEERNESMPAVIEHPFHTQHPLSLFTFQSQGAGIKCSMCDVDCHLALANPLEEVLYAFYRCDLCDFCLDMTCAATVVLSMSSATAQSAQISHEHQPVCFFTKEEIFINCAVCNAQISGEFIGCPDCRFFLHKDCIGAPETFKYSLHPEHHLTLTMFRQERSFVGGRRCPSCTRPLHNQLVYGCRECDFAIHVECARGTQAHDEKGCSTKVMVSRHEHPLTCFYTKTRIGNSCSGCEEDVQGEACCCLACKFFLHRSCLEPSEMSTTDKNESLAEKSVGPNAFPSVIEHPFHTAHPLSLVAGGSANVKCSICKVDCRLRSAGSSKEEELQAAYVCNQCNFCLGMTCATAVNPPIDARARIPRITHEHPLANFFAKAKIFISCVVCNTGISGVFFGCPTCCIFLHEDCVGSAPETFEYFLHTEHRLTLTMFAQKRSFTGPRRCLSCSRPLHNQLVYSCHDCDFATHIECARGMQAGHEKGDSAEIKLSWHEHPVRLSHRTNWPRESCSACREHIQGLCYVCLIDQCKLILHEGCATGLTSEIQHPHHPNHVLSLVPSPSRKLYKCEACLEEIEGFYFSCSKCAFYLDSKCGSRFPDTKHVLHEHKLLRFEKITSLECNVCCKNCESEFYRCVACNFNIHHQCMELPQTVKPKAHIHTMVLYDCYVEDDSGEYYCDFCEKRRNPDLGVYLCEQCEMRSKLVAHIECALSKTVIQKKDDNTEKVDERIASLKREVDEAKAKHDALLKKLKEAEGERLTLPF